MKRNFHLLFFLLIAVLLCLSCQEQQNIEKKNWRKSIYDPSLSSKDKIPFFLQAAQYYFSSPILDEDSGKLIFEELNRIALASDNPDLETIAQSIQIKYFSELKIDTFKMNQHIERILAFKYNLIKNDATFLLYLTAAAYYTKTNNTTEARRLLLQIDKYNTKDERQKIEALWIKADFNALVQNPIECLDNLLEARSHSAYLKNDSFLITCYKKISDYYFFQNKYGTSIEYLEKAKEILLSTKNLDSLDYFKLLLEMAIVENKAGNWDIAIIKSKMVTFFAKNKNYPKLFLEAESELRSELINKEDINGIADLYETSNNQLLQEFKNSNPILYFRLKAYIAEAHQQYDSSSYFFKEAEKLLNNKGNTYKANFYIRIAEYEKRRKNKDQVTFYYKKAFESIVASENFNAIIECGDSLLNHLKNPDIQTVFEINNAKDKLIKLQNNEKIRDIEISNVLKNRELDDMKNKETHARVSNLQIQILFLIIIIIFMSMIFISNFKVPKWWFKTMSYITLITLFELILYIVIYKLDFITNKEPLKVIGIKAAIIAILTPMHHWVEKSWVNFLSNHKVLTEFGDRLKMLFRRKKETPETQNP